jgi:hypothetical protein
LNHCPTRSLSDVLTRDTPSRSYDCCTNGYRNAMTVLHYRPGRQYKPAKYRPSFHNCHVDTSMTAACGLTGIDTPGPCFYTAQLRVPSSSSDYRVYRHWVECTDTHNGEARQPIPALSEERKAGQNTDHEAVRPN